MSKGQGSGGSLLGLILGLALVGLVLWLFGGTLFAGLAPVGPQPGTPGLRAPYAARPLTGIQRPPASELASDLPLAAEPAPGIGSLFGDAEPETTPLPDEPVPDAAVPFAPGLPIPQPPGPAGPCQPAPGVRVEGTLLVLPQLAGESFVLLDRVIGVRPADDGNGALVECEGGAAFATTASAREVADALSFRP